MKDTIILSLYKRPETVFILQEIALLFPEVMYGNLRKRMSYFAKTGSIKKLSRGVYAKDNYNVLELANKLYTPSYISLETVLQKAGVTFQYYESIFAVSYLTRTIEAGGHTIEYKRIKKDILLNKRGIEEQGNVIIATPERAFLDAVFLYKNYHFDNLGALNWDKIMELKYIYETRVFNKRVEEYYRIYKEEHA
jgi:predicted transcriptional regulator of viral defense system